MSRTRVHAGLALAAVGAVVLVPCRLRRLGPRPRVRTVRLAEAGIAPDRLEPRSGTGRRDARLPAGMDTVSSDHGTASVALLGGGGRIDGYLNASPGQGNETLADWSRFRPQHNQGEGDRGVRVLTTTAGRRFRSGRGSCVIDTCATSKARDAAAGRVELCRVTRCPRGRRPTTDPRQGLRA